MKIKISAYSVGVCVHCGSLSIYLNVKSCSEKLPCDFIHICFEACGGHKGKHNYEMIAYLLHKYECMLLDHLISKEIELPPNILINFKKPETIH